MLSTIGESESASNVQSSDKHLLMMSLLRGVMKERPVWKTSGLIERVSSKPRFLPVAQMALATVLTMVISHFTAEANRPSAKRFPRGMASQF